MTTTNNANAKGARSAQAAPLPSAMPKNNNPIRQQVLSGLIETQPSGWKKKVWNEEKKTVETVDVSHVALRYPLAENVSHEAVERLSRRWL